MRSRTVDRVAFVLAFVVVAAAFLFAANASIAHAALAESGPDATVTGISESPDGETLIATIELHNPTREDLDIVDAEGRIYLRGVIVTTRAETDARTVPAGETRELTVRYGVSPDPYGDRADALGTQEMLVQVVLEGRVVRAPIDLRISQRGVANE